MTGYLVTEIEMGTQIEKKKIEKIHLETHLSHLDKRCSKKEKWLAMELN